MDLYLEAYQRALHSYKARDEMGLWPSHTYMLCVLAFLLIHREIRVEKNCMRNYGKNWKEDRTTVPWRLLSSIKKRKVESIRSQSKESFGICGQDDMALSRDLELRYYIKFQIFMQNWQVSALSPCCSRAVGARLVIFPTRSRYARFLDTLYVREWKDRAHLSSLCKYDSQMHLHYECLKRSDKP